MKWILILGVCLQAVLPVSAQETNPLQIRIVYPANKQSLPALDRIFVFGSVSPPTAAVTVNGLDTPMVRSSTGGWLVMVPLQMGKFAITARAVLDNGTETPDVCTDVCRVNVEKSGANGPPQKPVDKGDLAVHKPPEEKMWRPVRYARIYSDTAYLRSGPNVTPDDQAGYELPLQKNVLVTLVGQIDKTLHVRLSDLESVWVDAGYVKLLPKNTPEPQSYINAWTIRRLPRSTLLQTTLQELLPYRVTLSPDGRSISIKIYGGISNTDWIHYASDDPWIRQARWSHPIRGVYQLDVDLRRPVWGYDIRYENFKLILELRDPPPAPAAPVVPSFRKRESTPVVNHLENLKVCIDPGHPPMGAIGPHGIPEHAVNWQLAVALRDVLINSGAQVVMTRQEGETVPLPDRSIRARAAAADLFVSIHTNALAPADNPFEKNGFSVYAFQPFSQLLAEEVHRAIREQIPLRDDGLHFGNLHVIRQSYMPAILVECAYLIWPPEEEMILDPEFQNRCAMAIASGIRSFMEKRRAED